MKTVILAGALLAAVASNAFAADFDVVGVAEVGASVSGDPAVRFGLRMPTKWAWLNTEVGVMGTKNGGIVDVTPMWHIASIGKDAWVEAGIGIGDNFINDPKQAQGLILHDLVRVGYKNFFVEGVHYSNGGSFNPLFGTHNNGGFTYFMGGVMFNFK